MPKQETQRELQALLSRVGQGDQIIDTVMRVDAVMQYWRRRMNKRELGLRAIEVFRLDIDMAQMDVLFAIAAPDHEFIEEAETETMVSTVAERLAIDPSRASRLVAEMVTAGYAVRAVSQKDARRTILELTPSGWAVVRAVHAYKWLVLGDFFSQWDKQELSDFLPMLEKFSSWAERREQSEAKFAAEIQNLSDIIAGTRSDTGSGRKSG